MNPNARRITVSTQVKVSAILVLNEQELGALDAIIGYGTNPFLKAFKEKLGRAYIEPYEEGVHSLFDRIREVVAPALQQARDARRDLQYGQQLLKQARDQDFQAEASKVRVSLRQGGYSEEEIDDLIEACPARVDLQRLYGKRKHPEKPVIKTCSHPTCDRPAVVHDNLNRKPWCADHVPGYEHARKTGKGPSAASFGKNEDGTDLSR